MDRKWAKVADSHVLGQRINSELDGSTLAHHPDGGPASTEHLF